LEETMNAKWMPARAALALLAAVALATGCGVSKSKYLESTQGAEQLTAKNQALQQSLDAAMAKSEQLEKDVAAAKEETARETAKLNAELESSKQAVVNMQSTYEGLVGQLRGEVEGGKVQIQKVRDGIRVNLAQDILFKSGSANLDPSGKELLTKEAEELKGSNHEVLVIGHADNQKIGAVLAQRYPTNWELGSARASQIARLFQEAGIESQRMLAVSAADGRPRADNASAEGRAQNRRIEIILRPNEPVAEAGSN
jgi:chemotaxis protein MotB